MMQNSKNGRYQETPVHWGTGWREMDSFYEMWHHQHQQQQWYWKGRQPRLRCPGYKEIKGQPSELQWTPTHNEQTKAGSPWRKPRALLGGKEKSKTVQPETLEERVTRTECLYVSDTPTTKTHWMDLAAKPLLACRTALQSWGWLDGSRWRNTGWSQKQQASWGHKRKSTKEYIVWYLRNSGTPHPCKIGKASSAKAETQFELVQYNWQATTGTVVF